MSEIKFLYETFGPGAVVFVAGYFSIRLGLNGNKAKINTINENVKEIKETIKQLPCFDHEKRIGRVEGKQEKQ